MADIISAVADRITPETIDEVVASVQQARAMGLAIYPVGGGTSLDYGLPPRTRGLAIDMTRCCRVVDYPARDLTITVEAGITMAELDATLRQQGQWLPIDVPQASRATLGGVIATNFSGPRRFGYGTMRDYVIGIEGVAADGRRFKAGGRVVKNVAGYDFCKLLTGSLGTLAVITQVTLKLKPRPQRSRIVVLPIESWSTLEPCLAKLNEAPIVPTAIEVTAGQEWDLLLSPLSGTTTSVSTVAQLAVLLEGTATEVDWMTDQLCATWQSDIGTSGTVLDAEATEMLLTRWNEFPQSNQSALVMKVSLLPSQVADMTQFIRDSAADSNLLVHAGDGVIIAKFSSLPAGGISQFVVRQLRPKAQRAGGHAIILSNPGQGEMTHQAVWGGAPQFALMQIVKRAWDPENVLNPERFVYDQ